MMVNLDEYFIVFFGECHGIGFSLNSDNYIIVSFLTEDDGNWHCSDSGVFSSHWADDFNRVWSEAMLWLKTRATKKQWGYQVKKVQ